jgi:HPt (histidine-containing phosphotransfer) domain-containing protein
MVDFSKLPEEFVDYNDAIARVGGDEAFYAELLEDLRNLGQECLPKLRDAMKTKNGSLLSETAHMLKGAAGNLGLKQLPQIALQLEIMGKNNDFTHVPNLIELTNKEFNTLGQFLDNQ